MQKFETIGGTTTTTVYGYDTAGRLTDVTVGGSLAAHYDYDGNGNRLAVTRAGVGTVSGTYDAQDRLLTYGALTYTYTANGDLQATTSNAGTTSYGYDVFGNLAAVTLPTGTQIEYVIDGQNRRIGKKVNGSLVQGFLYGSQLRPVAELDGTGTILSRFVYGTKLNVPEYMVKGGATYRLLTDHLGSVRLVVSSTDGTIAQRIDYDEFGQITQDTNPGFQPFGFAGGLYDPDTKLVRFGARDYDPFMGRWTTKDPIGLAGGDPSLHVYADSVGKPLETNLYSFVVINPLTFIDPLGLWGFSTGFEGAGAAFGFGAFGGIYGNFAHNPSQPWYRGWSSSVTVTLGGGAAASACGAATGVHFSGNNACDVKQLEKGFLSAGRLGMGWLSVEGYTSPDRTVTGAGITYGPAVGYIGAMAGGSYTWTLGGGQWQ